MKDDGVTKNLWLRIFSLPEDQRRRMYNDIICKVLERRDDFFCVTERQAINE